MPGDKSDAVGESVLLLDLPCQFDQHLAIFDFLQGHDRWSHCSDHVRHRISFPGPVRTTRCRLLPGQRGPVICRVGVKKPLQVPAPDHDTVHRCGLGLANGADAEKNGEDNK